MHRRATAVINQVIIQLDFASANRSFQGSKKALETGMSNISALMDANLAMEGNFEFISQF